MSFDLFADSTLVANPTTPQGHDSAAVSPEVKHETNQIEPEPAPALSIPDSVAETYQTGLDAAVAAIAEITQPMRAHYGRGFDPFEDALRKLPCSNSLNREMFKVIVRQAKQTGLAAPGDYQFEDDFDQYLTGLDRHGGWDDDNTVKVDIRGLCNAIYSAYAGDAGDKIEHRRVARALIRQFDLEKKMIEPKKGFVELVHYNYLEKASKGGYNFNYGAKPPIEQTIANLKHVFNQSNLIVDMSELRLALRDCWYKVEPNKTVFFGDIGDDPLTVKVFKEQLRWKFTEHCIAILSDFVSEYGSED